MEGWYGTILNQVTLAAHDDDEHLVFFVAQVLRPFIELVERAFVVDGVAEHAYVGTVEEEMRQVVDRNVPCRVPDIQRQIVISPIPVCHRHRLREV